MARLWEISFQKSSSFSLSRIDLRGETVGPYQVEKEGGEICHWMDERNGVSQTPERHADHAGRVELQREVFASSFMKKRRGYGQE
jgi:hypothetical protein